MDNLNHKVSETPPVSPISEDVTSSISSEVFESWTLVSDKNKAAKKAAYLAQKEQEGGEEDSDGSANRVEILNSDRDDTESSKSNLETPAKASDDLSDGISVISDSESELRNPATNVRLRFSSSETHEMPTTSHVAAHDSCGESHQVSRLRRRRSSDPSSSSVRSSVEVKTHTSHPAIRCGVTSLFYAGVLLAILGFIGKLRYPEWDTSTTIEAFEAKLHDLEMQNNLMRAEVDILSKQVDYLTSLNENPHQRYRSKDEDKSPPRKEQYRNNPKQNGNNGKKVFKARPEVADGVTDKWNEQPVQCDKDKIYNEIAGVCVDRLGNELPIADTTSQNIGDGKPQNFQHYENKINKLHEKLSNDEQIYKQNQPPYSKDGKKHSYPTDKENIPYNAENRNGKYPNMRSSSPERSRQYHGSGDKAYNKGKKFEEKGYRPHYKKDDDDDHDDSREKFDQHKHKKFQDHEDGKYKQQSRDSFPKKYQEDGKYKNQPRESSQKKFEEHEDGKYKHQPRESHPKFDDWDGDNKNWYIARGDGRQQARFTGHRRRR